MRRYNEPEFDVRPEPARVDETPELPEKYQSAAGFEVKLSGTTKDPFEMLLSLLECLLRTTKRSGGAVEFDKLPKASGASLLLALRECPTDP